MVELPQRDVVVQAPLSNRCRPVRASRGRRYTGTAASMCSGTRAGRLTVGTMPMMSCECAEAIPFGAGSAAAAVLTGSPGVGSLTGGGGVTGVGAAGVGCDCGAG